eukprot:TRINITY_DN1723_c0_g1_i1.p1 TRINITY_DN1723_c0_g1~~TRINITY_DN1723_c0_g1_i1.p1  ORF type:complete len:115 (-),score=19.01 TRINITY_DN1723_c0_g1_i1:252-596(-)
MVYIETNNTVELEVSRQFGDSIFSFYAPIDVKDFTVMIWSTSKSNTTNSQPNSNLTYSCSIYEGGMQLSREDVRLSNFDWARCLDWAGEPIFTFKDITKMLEDLRRLASKSPTR